MKRRWNIHFSVEPDQRGDLLRFLDEIGCAEALDKNPLWVVPVFDYTFDEHDPRMRAVEQFIRDRQLKSLQRCDVTYSTRELRAAPLLVFSVRMPERDTGRHSVDQFDFSTGCPRCHTGARQVAPLVVRPQGYGHSGLPRKGLICSTLDDEFLVAEPLYEALSAANLGGLEFMQVLSMRGAPLPWWQVIPRHVMPRMAPETTGISRDLTPTQAVPDPGCRLCERDTHCVSGLEPPQIIYRRSQLGSAPLPDIAETWEAFGISAFEVNGYIARGLLLVSVRVFEALRRAKVRGVDFEPVRIIED